MLALALRSALAIAALPRGVASSVLARAHPLMSLVYLNTFIFMLLFSVDVGFEVRVGVGVGVGVAVGVKDFILKATHLNIFSLFLLRFHLSNLFYGNNDFHYVFFSYGASMH